MKVLSVLAIAAVLFGTDVHARGANFSPVTDAAAMTSRCSITKLSVKGSNGGFFSGPSKSIEGTCTDSGGKSIAFSASSAVYNDIVKSAGADVILATVPNSGAQKIPDSKSDYAAVSILPVSPPPGERILCGPADPSAITWGEKAPFSVGFRIARPSTMQKTKDGWMMRSYIGFTGGELWTTGDEDADPTAVYMSAGCANVDPNNILADTGGRMIFDYAQYTEGGAYYVARVAVLDVK